MPRGRPAGSQNKDKPVREALRMEAALAAEGKQCTAPKGSLRHAARQLLIRAGEETTAFREIGDRLDGKPAQAIIGGEDGDNPLAMQIIAIQHTIITPRHKRSDDQD
jgi:hypothetical protein